MSGSPEDKGRRKDAGNPYDGPERRTLAERRLAERRLDERRRAGIGEVASDRRQHGRRGEDRPDRGDRRDAP